ncbi:PilW family protein [Methylocaldum sp. GT1BB]|uniref:PilW family protein n=1 Tax=Methylocaldum sp. GT1BB TaxID=3438963 RepID=UPI003D9FF758
MRTPIFAMTVPPNSYRGVTLIELMISLTIGLLLTAVLGYAFLGSRQAFRTTDTLSRMQESARYAFERISSDIRMAGFTGCSFSTMANVLNTATDWDKDLFGFPLVGYEDTANPTYPNGVSGNVLRGDALTVLRADNSREWVVVHPPGHNASAATIPVAPTHNIQPGEILVITDCRHAAVFQMTGPANIGNNSNQINHTTGNSTAPGNFTKCFGIGTPSDPMCGSANSQLYTYAPGSRILRLSAATYYIRTNDAGEPALYRQRLIASGGNAATTAEEMVEGVQDMQIQYGENTDGAPGVDTYVTADGVTNWTNVLSIRISLLMVSLSDESITTAPQAYTYNGATITPTDRLLRKAFTTTISVRNRL